MWHDLKLIDLNNKIGWRGQQVKIYLEKGLL